MSTSENGIVPAHTLKAKRSQYKNASERIPPPRKKNYLSEGEDIDASVIALQAKSIEQSISQDVADTSD